jgi:hypothetical protein
VIELEGDQLVLKLGRSIPLVPLSADRFSLLGEYSIRFEVEDGKPVMVPEQAALGNERFDLMPRFTPTAAELAAYAGDYYAPELDVTWRLAVNGNGLTAELRGRRLATLAPTTLDAFASTEGSSLTFTRKGKRITGFTVQAGRVRNIAFARQP